MVGILFLSMNAGAWILSRPLEAWYSPQPVPAESVDAIVILAGSVRPPTPNQPYSFVAPDTYERLQHGIWLFQHWKPLPILVCGGSLRQGTPYATTMKSVLESAGIPSSSIWTETQSRSTHENAVYGSPILRMNGVKRIALIVEASYMPRAAASFRKAGFAVIPMPIRFTQLDIAAKDFVPHWQAIALNGENIHELVGLAWYRLRGWI
jgi:uncharacterized SAM-binding protein YcdF (DUF218 family)